MKVEIFFLGNILKNGWSNISCTLESTACRLTDCKQTYFEMKSGKIDFTLAAISSELIFAQLKSYAHFKDFFIVLYIEIGLKSYV